MELELCAKKLEKRGFAWPVLIFDIPIWCIMREAAKENGREA